MTSIQINEKKHTIEMTKKTYDKACKFGTQEYFDLQEVRKAYPNYRVVKVTQKASKNTYKGLTYEYMEKYIAAHDDEKKTIMAEYKMMRGTSEEAKEALAEPVSYYEMKVWFLKKFPAIAEFHKKREEALAA